MIIEIKNKEWSKFKEFLTAMDIKIDKSTEECVKSRLINKLQYLIPRDCGWAYIDRKTTEVLALYDVWKDNNKEEEE